MMALQCCVDHLEVLDRKRCRREGRDWRREAVVGRTATGGKRVCDYVGKSLLPEQARTRTHRAISSLRKNACAILVMQVNIPEVAAEVNQFRLKEAPESVHKIEHMN